jgi:two-component system, OmpR family, response regulator
MRILLIEDDRTLSDAIAKALRGEGFGVETAYDGENFDAVVLDLGLPKRDGVTVLADWRAEGRAMPVLILTARDAWSDKVKGFRAGADDYLVKPFRVEELILRLRALIRRAAGHAATVLTLGELSFDSQTGQFELSGLPLRLTAFEWRIMSIMMLRPDTVIDRMELTERVYEGDLGSDSNSLDVIVSRLRKKIAPAKIEAVRGHGYLLSA